MLSRCLTAAHAWRCRTAAGELPGDLYVVPAPWPRRGRPVKYDIETWRVIDDWPQRVPAAARNSPNLTSAPPKSSSG